MRLCLAWLWALGCLGFLPAEASVQCPNTNQLKVATLSLPDQFGRERTFSIPQPTLSVLTVADQKGSEEITAWVQSLKRLFGVELPIEGVADVSRVPRLLRPLVRKRFSERLQHPVLLDWEGGVVSQLRCQPNTANVFLLSTNGEVLLTLHGAVDGRKLEQLQNAVRDSQPPARTPMDVSPPSLGQYDQRH
jgi:hypothetical protein